MNRHAIVLAADSATTVSQWTGERREVRYFKGANKIFQLSDSKPVGIMIYDSADILSVPWETVIKMFRVELGDRSFNELSGYKDEFFAFLSENRRLFPDEVREEALIEAAITSGIRPMVREDLPPELPRDQQIDFAVREDFATLDATPFIAPFTEAHIASIIGTLSARLEVAMHDMIQAFQCEGLVDAQNLIRLGVTTVLKMPTKALPVTGLVFAGFGEHSIFPSHINCVSCGLVLNDHVLTSETPDAVDHKNPASLTGFAQTAMTETFTLGLSEDVYVSTLVRVDEEMHAFAQRLCDAAGIAIESVDNLDVMVQDARRNVGQSLLNDASNTHSIPLRRVVGVLPIDEMAELAETLVNLQSLKEKVTTPSQTVGGPIDVAVITKSEGLVWLKRKHYFDPSLNPRFMKRLRV
jgi:hypothetical protein